MHRYKKLSQDALYHVHEKPSHIYASCARLTPSQSFQCHLKNHIFCIQLECRCNTNSHKKESSCYFIAITSFLNSSNLFGRDFTTRAADLSALIHKIHSIPTLGSLIGLSASQQRKRFPPICELEWTKRSWSAHHTLGRWDNRGR